MKLDQYMANAGVDQCVYEECEIHRNVTVIVSQCQSCGKIDISWERQPNTEDVIIKPLEDIEYAGYTN